MGSGSRERIVEVFDALDAELDRLDEVSFEVLTTPERLRSLERLECLVRRLPAVGHALINQLNTHGHTEWLPPPHLDHGQPRTNTFHHPERFLHNQDDDDEPD